MSSVATANNQTLAPKEVTLFKKILKCYEQKQYKAGLRCAKQILMNPNFSEHGETLAMKGLILNSMGKHEEALELVRRGLNSALCSHVCWHVLGVVKRSDKKYDEAMKAYKIALKYDKDSLQILRDLSLLQIQMRDLEGYRKSRHHLLVLRPTNKMNWISYANACHLVGDYDMALNIIRDFRKNNKPTSKFDLEISEIILYEVMILREAGRHQQALTKLEENALFIIDRLSYLETRAELLIELNRLEDAENVYWSLIDRNADNIFYYKQIEKCQQIDLNDETSNKKKIKDIYEKALKRRPKATVPQLLILFCLEDKKFEESLFFYLKNYLRKGVPSLFKNLVPLYQNEKKVKIIENILLDFIENIEKNGYNNGSLDGSSLPECPTTILWVYYYLAQHFDRLKQYEKAHKFIDKALEHTPTLIELYMAKAKIYKHEENFQEAANMTNKAQKLDTADRYINSKCAKYLLRANKIEEAELMCAKFTREGVNATESLVEMQCMWYELECAKAYYRLEQYGEALKKCHEIERCFVLFYEDQFDFHSYCIRKMTLCAYVKILRFEEVLRDQYYYIEALKLATTIYLLLVNQPEKFIDKDIENTENLNDANLKKIRHKANKAKAAEKKSTQPKNNIVTKKRVDGELDVVEPEPLDPQKLLKVENPINEAAKFIQPILLLPCKDIDVYLIGFDVYYHKNKPLLMLQCLKKAHSIDSMNERFKQAAVKYLEKYKTLKMSELLGEIVTELTEKFESLL